MLKSYFTRENLTIPNAISFLRILIIIPFVYLFLNFQYIPAMVVLGLSGLSDMFDGMIARKLHQESKLGEMLDPIADKLTLMSIVICFAINFPVVFPVIILMLLKEIIMLSGGLYLIGKNISPPKAKWYGKLSTVVFYTVTIVIVALQAIWGIKDDMMALILVGIAAIFMIYTLVRYTIMFFKLLKENGAE